MLYQSSLGNCNFSYNDPNDKEANLSKIVKHIDPDLILFQEIGSQANNIIDLRDDALNTEGVTKYKFTTFESNSSLANHAFYNENKLGYVGHEAIDRGVNNQNIVRLIDVYTFYYLDPELANGADTTYLTTFVAHFKASQGSSNEAERAVAAEAIMNYVSNHTLTNYILAGDLNVYTSNEPAYQELTNSGNTALNFIDPTGIDGDWNNNDAGQMELVHTQSTHSSSHPCFSGGGLDDRFDFILINQSLENNTDFLEYEPFSYKVVGNDGNRFNGNIVNPNNASVPQDVAQAMYDLSDHLPVVVTLNAYPRSPSTVFAKQQLFSVKILNPVTNGELRIQNNNDRSLEAELFDVSGKRIRSFVIPTGRNTIKLETYYQPGIYFLRFPNSDIPPRKLVII